jgi:hypothetical protein
MTRYTKRTAGCEFPAPGCTCGSEIEMSLIRGLRSRLRFNTSDKLSIYFLHVLRECTHALDFPFERRERDALEMQSRISRLSACGEESERAQQPAADESRKNRGCEMTFGFYGCASDSTRCTRRLRGDSLWSADKNNKINQHCCVSHFDKQNAARVRASPPGK